MDIYTKIADEIKAREITLHKMNREYNEQNRQGMIDNISDEAWMYDFEMIENELGLLKSLIA